MTDRIFAAVEFVGWLSIIVAGYALLGLLAVSERIGKAVAR